MLAYPLQVVPTEEKKVQLSAKAAKHAESVESLKQQISEIEGMCVVIAHD